MNYSTFELEVQDQSIRYSNRSSLNKTDTQNTKYISTILNSTQAYNTMGLIYILISILDSKFSQAKRCLSIKQAGFPPAPTY